MAKTKSTAPTGLSITRSNNTYTISWKVGAKNYDAGQTLQYRVNDGTQQQVKWANGNTTTYTITQANVYKIWCRVHGKRKKDSKSYDWSNWTETTWNATAPAVPTLTYENGGTNLGTFTWSCAVDSTSTAVFTRVEAQTCYERNAGVSQFPGAALVTKSNAGSETITEDSTVLAAGNIVRWYRVRSYGPGGYSNWNTIYHAYGAPSSATVTAASAVTYGSTTRISASWSIGHNDQYPIDMITLQYVVDVPTDVDMTAPISGWSDAIDITVKGSYDSIVVNVDDAISDDECLWVRVKTEHDGLASYSAEKVAQYGVLKAPTIDATPNTSTGAVSITTTEETTCGVANTAIFYRLENDPSNDRIITILPHGTTTATVNVPEIIGASTTCFGAYAFVGTYSGTAITSVLMRSESDIDSDIASVAPTSVTVTEGPMDESVRIGWSWSWNDATIAELSWADNPYAWESTEEPSTYQVEDSLATSWIIAGLEVGKRWYFRVRLINGSGDDNVVGPWSSTVTYDLASVPDRPALTLSKNVINEGETITARWAFSSSDGVTQEYAEICLVTFDSEGVPTYGDVIAHTDAAQSVEITRDWTTGQTYYLALRTTSTSGIQSAWSEVASVFVVEPVSIDLGESSIDFGGSYVYTTREEQKVFTDGVPSSSMSETTDEYIATSGMSSTLYHYYLSGTTTTVNTTINGNTTTIDTVTTTYDFAEDPHISYLPITVEIYGAGTSGTTTAAIIRAEDRHMDRPDERDYDGYEGEAIATVSRLGEGELSITADDLIGSLEDDCMYYLIGKVVDEYGQSASFRYPFSVDWGYKPDVPSATVEMDTISRIAKITPIAGSADTNKNASCDIYRLSADKPELVVKDAAFGTTYVDPYPAFGESGGHRIVAKNVFGDYTTAHGLAWHDAQRDDNDYLKDENMVIDVDGEQIVLPYDITLSNRWNKDFKRTSYLGGSVQGDWNPAVTRDISADTVLIRGRDLDRQLSMRDLAGYAGIAHVRTPDGSSVTANVQIEESQAFDTKKVSYSLTIQAIDPDSLDGMTLADWEDDNPIGE